MRSSSSVTEVLANVLVSLAPVSLDDGEENVAAGEEGLMANGCGKADRIWEGVDGESGFRATIEEDREVVPSSRDGGERGPLVLGGAGVV